MVISNIYNLNPTASANLDFVEIGFSWTEVLEKAIRDGDAEMVNEAMLNIERARVDWERTSSRPK